MISRRTVLRALGAGVLAAPPASLAQPRPKQVGFLLNGSAADYAKEVEALREGRRDRDLDRVHAGRRCSGASPISWTGSAGLVVPPAVVLRASKVIDSR
jgi:hypothetical protein